LKGDERMYSASQVANLIAQWGAEGLSDPEIVQKAADACVGWPYVWGGYGQVCSPSNRKSYADRSSCPDAEAEVIRKKCQVLNGKQLSGCAGCKYFPNGEKVRFFDCRGFTRWLLQQIGLSLKGSGATSQWNDSSNWQEKGLIAQIPQDRVCCVFMANGKKMSHTGMHIGGGIIVHCSGEVKRGKITDKGWTHYAIPKGLNGTVSAPANTPETKPAGNPTLKKGSRGDYVTALQTQLIMLAYDPGKVDGIFGVKTQEAVKKFQQDSGLKADGIVGKDTWAALERGKAAEELYSLKIEHLHKSDAEALQAKYGGVLTKE
jgi:hypothetical protein